MKSPDWPRIVSSGALWTLVYNGVWAFAWFAFMEGEWMAAAATTGAPMPWTAGVWFVWVLATALLGVAIMAYTEGHASSTRHSIIASMAVWVLVALSMAFWCLKSGYSVRVTALDTVVNFVGMLAAGFVGAWGLRPPKLR